MMRRRTWLIFCGALLSGTLAGSLSFVYQQNAPGEKVIVREMPTVDVAIAAQDMSVGTVVSDSNLRVVKWPRDEVPEGATGDVKKLVGSSVSVPIARGEPITPRRVTDKAGGRGVLALIPNGMRAITLKLNETSATFINPGMNVDVIGTLQSGHTRVIMQNVRVLAVGLSIQPPSSKAPTKANTSNLVTVLVTPAEAEELALAAQKATIQLALRNNMDSDVERTPGVRLTSLFNERNEEPAPPPRAVVRSAPVAAPKKAEVKPPAETVDLFRREKKSTVTVKPGS